MEEELAKIFFPLSIDRQRVVREKSLRFVHYTSAEVAASILQNAEVWMRKATLMNDFREIDYGLECLHSAYRSDQGKRFQSEIDDLFPDLRVEFQDSFNGWQDILQQDTYVSSLSEHYEGEDVLGRLSMWRAYGGENGVALVLKNGPFLSTTHALGAYSSPVAYFTAEQVAPEFGTITNRIKHSRSFLSACGRDRVSTYVFAMMRYAALCTKHPGFYEEREWRVVYTPKLESSPLIKAKVKCIRGTAQIIQIISLRDAPEIGLIGLEIPKFLDRIIIGPTRYPYASYEAFVELLRDAGVERPEAKVFVSDIPLRYT